MHEYFSEMNEIAKLIDDESLNQIIELIRKAKEEKRRVYIFGNGGSCANADHWVNGILKESKIRIFSLMNAPVITAYGNDEGYANIFVDQIEQYVEPNDIVIGITGSGNSPNICNGLIKAREKGAITIALLGFNGGKIKENGLADYILLIPSNNYGIIEDLHSAIGHILCQELKDD